MKKMPPKKFKSFSNHKEKWIKTALLFSKKASTDPSCGAETCFFLNNGLDSRSFLSLLNHDFNQPLICLAILLLLETYLPLFSFPSLRTSSSPSL